MNTVVIDGKTYNLVPAKEEDIVSKYLVDKPEEGVVVKGGVQEAVGKVSDYRERYVKGQLTIDDVKARPKAMVDDGFKKRENSFFSGFDQDTVIGDGTVDDFILN